MSTLRIPSLSLVALIGASGAGKSSFARKHFLPTEVISSDACRGWVADDDNDQSATPAAFDLLFYIVAKRLAAGRLTVIDATCVRPEDRKKIIAIAREYHVLPVAIVLDLPERVCHERNAARANRDFGPHVVRQQCQLLHKSLRHLEREGFRGVHVLRSVEAVDAVQIERERLWNDRRDEHGPFDLIGDIHGCRDELVTLLETLGYTVAGSRDAPEVTPPAGRKAVFVGDLVDRGPDSPGVLKLVMAMVAAGHALCVPGNHDVKLMRKLNGRDVKITHGLAETLAQLEGESAEFKQTVARFVDGLVSHLVLDDGKLVVAHAGLKENLQGRSSGVVREFALYGETTGETDEFGLPVRYDWARDYRGKAMVVYGHTPVPVAEWINRTICIDTGCVFGGSLTALRYPENTLVAVPAEREYYAPIRPLQPEVAVPVARERSLLDLDDVLGKRVIRTRYGRNITVREENACAALEVMSRYAVDPRWLVYLPPTMAPPETAPEGDALERPAEAFGYYADQGVTQLVCQEKHMGSRAVLLLCRDEAAAARRFGIAGAGRGVIWTRTGRRFFTDLAVERALLDRVEQALVASGLWDELASDWILLDGELLPWSAKAQELLQRQYAPTGLAATRSLGAAGAALERARARGIDIGDLGERLATRRSDVARYIDAWRRYCWPVDGLSGLKYAPFQILAAEKRLGPDHDVRWHLEHLDRLCAAEPTLLKRTERRFVDLAEPESVEAASDWWTALTAAGGEGMVIKPVEAYARGSRGLVQPGIKCRGREYLRIIYGPTYTEPEHLERLRRRGVRAKRSLAEREHLLGLEALARLADGDALYRIHECVFGVLALESEPMDPRL